MRFWVSWITLQRNAHLHTLKHVKGTQACMLGFVGMFIKKHNDTFENSQSKEMKLEMNSKV